MGAACRVSGPELPAAFGYEASGVRICSAALLRRVLIADSFVPRHSASCKHMTERSPFAEPAAALFVCLLWAMADFFYKEALVIRSEVTGMPALVK
jgi:hypothetical protein